MLLLWNSSTAHTWLGDPLIASQLACCLCTWYSVFYAQNIIYRVQLDSRKFSSGSKGKSTFCFEKASNPGDQHFHMLHSQNILAKMLGTENVSKVYNF